MTATMQERRAAYRKRKEQFAKENDNAAEAIRWHVTTAILEEFPEAEFQWEPLDHPGLLEVRVRVRDYGASLKIDRDSIERADYAVVHAIADLKNRLGIGPLCYLFD